MNTEIILSRNCVALCLTVSLSHCLTVSLSHCLTETDDPCTNLNINTEPECLCRLLMALHPMAGASREPSKYKTLFVKFDFYGSHNMAHIIWMSRCMSCLRSPKAISQALASMNKLPPGIKPIISHSPPLHGFICLVQL